MIISRLDRAPEGSGVDLLWKADEAQKTQPRTAREKGAAVRRAYVVGAIGEFANSAGRACWRPRHFLQRNQSTKRQRSKRRDCRP